MTETRCRARSEDDFDVTPSEATFTSLLDGRFLQEEHEGTMFGQPFRRHKLFGYNNATGEFEAIWLHGLHGEAP